MDVLCTICMEGVVIPVELHCFPCSVVDRIHCNTFTRLCFGCAFHYLELYKSRFARDTVKKCLMCPGHADPTRLAWRDAMRVDFFMMRRDDGRHSCPFCGEFEDTQIHLYTHIATCPSFPVECGCGIVMKREELVFHYFLCARHVFCASCGSYVLKDTIDAHLRGVHAMVRCVLCGSVIPADQEEEHAEAWCPERLVACAVCFCLQRFHGYEQHLLEHKTHLLREISAQKDVMDALMEQYRTIERNILHLRRSLVQN
jgi:hypothetical protein